MKTNWPDRVEESVESEAKLQRLLDEDMHLFYSQELFDRHIEGTLDAIHGYCNLGRLAIRNSRTRTEEKTMNEDLGGVSATDLIFRFQELVWRIGQLEYREKLANFQGMGAPVPVAMRLEASALGDEIIKRMVG